MKGAAAESIAAQYLTRQGLRLLTANYRCRFGEIDLVLRDGATLVFAEVRLRASERFGGAIESITTAKRAKLDKTARHYLSSHGIEAPCRFDVVLMRGLNAREIEWIKNAFGE